MTVENDVAKLYGLLMSEGASEEAAQTVALGLCRELMPGADSVAVREAVARAVAMVRIKALASNDTAPPAKKPGSGPRRRSKWSS